MSTCTQKFWMYNWNTLENSATLVSANCVNCRRYWDEDLRAVQRNVCLLDSYMPTNCPGKFGFLDPILHLKLDDAYASPKVYSDPPVFPQTFLDPGGDPNTNAHSVAGHVDTALTFDGVDDRIALTAESHQPYLAADTDFTLALWVKANSPGPTANLRALSSSEGVAAGMFVGFVNNYYRIRFCTVSGGTPYITYSDSPSPIDANWHHCAIVRFNYTVTIYFDASVLATSTQSQNALIAYTPGTLMNLGSTAVPDKFAPCNLDDLRLYTRALSAAEIAILAA